MNGKKARRLRRLAKDKHRGAHNCTESDLYNELKEADKTGALIIKGNYYDRPLKKERKDEIRG